MKYLAILVIAFSFSLPASQADAFCGLFRRCCKPRCCRIFKCCKRRCCKTSYSTGGSKKYYADPPSAPEPPAPVVTPTGVLPAPK